MIHSSLNGVLVLFIVVEQRNQRMLRFRGGNLLASTTDVKAISYLPSTSNIEAILLFLLDPTANAHVHLKKKIRKVYLESRHGACFASSDQYMPANN